MASPVKEIVPAQFAPSAQSTLYTSPPGTTTRIDKLSVSNSSGAPAQITINMVPAGGTPDGSNATTVLKTVPANDTWNSPNEYGHYLNPGDFLAVLAGTPNALAILVGGTQVSA